MTIEFLEKLKEDLNMKSIPDTSKKTFISKRGNIAKKIIVNYSEFGKREVIKS